MVIQFCIVHVKLEVGLLLWRTTTLKVTFVFSVGNQTSWCILPLSGEALFLVKLLSTVDEACLRNVEVNCSQHCMMFWLIISTAVKAYVFI